jgi:hypothetical protein
VSDPTASLDALLADIEARQVKLGADLAALRGFAEGAVDATARRLTAIEGRLAALETDPEPEPEPEPPRSALLTFRPPTLVDPLVVTLPAATGRYLIDGRGRDVRLVWPAVKRGAVRVRNARHVVSVGGHSDVANTTASGDGDRRVVELGNISGTMHIEGLLATHSSGIEGDGIYVTNCQGATVQLGNCEIPDVRGSRAGDHGDIVQLYQAGLAKLAVDGLYASTSYQGFGDFDNPRSLVWSLRRVRIGWDQIRVDGGGQLIWPGTGTKVTLDDVRVSGTRTGLSTAQVLYPGGVLTGDRVTSPQAAGHVSVGPLDRDLGFTAGLGYQSPGYI